MRNVELSVVIVSYRNLQVLIDCIESVYKYNDIKERLEVIIVDNSPEDIIYKYISNHFKQVIIVRNDNKGFGEGNNVGAKMAKGEYLLFLNPDTILIEPIFQFTINQFEKNNKLALFGVKLVNIKLKRNMSYYLMDKHGFLAGQLIKLFNKLGFYIDGMMFISGADLFVRKDMFFQIGMFDENIFMYGEEADLIRRLKQYKAKTAYFNSKRIIHLEGKTNLNYEISLKRRLDSQKYYSEKYNLIFQKQINQELRYNYLKLPIYKLISTEMYLRTKNIISILKKYD